MSDRETPANPVPPGFPGPDFEIFVMNADGSRLTQITFNEFDDENPAWSPDGKRIVFQRDLDPVRGQTDYDIFTMKADGSHQRNRTNNPARLTSTPTGHRTAAGSRSAATGTATPRSTR